MPLLEEGQVFARYRVFDKVGSGTSGDSYKAEDVEHQHTVMLKLIHPWSILSDSGRYQFLREMQLANTIVHPQLASPLDYGEVAGQLYAVRRYVDSGSLTSLQGRHLLLPPLSIADAFGYIYQLAQILYHLHIHNYVHGSLTLANILVYEEHILEAATSSATLIVADAGLAHFVRRFGQHPQTILPITAAPEQFDKYISPASDQYALAILLYLWLAGRPPFLGSVEETSQMKLTATFPSLLNFRSDITIEQESILYKALSVYPDERYPSIIDFAEAMLTTLASAPRTQQEPMQPPEPLPQTEPDIPQPLPNPEPIPQPIPDPETIPTPDSTPDVEPIPAPEPLPEPAPDIPPQIEPDIAQPLPEPGPIPNPTEPATEPRFLLRSPQSSEPQELVLTQDEMTLGRAESNTIVLDQDTSTSRRHAILRRDQHNFVIYDWDSINGVIVNGQRLTTENGHVLKDGDIISIGEYTLMFQAPASVEKFAVPIDANNAYPERQTQSAQLQTH